MDIHTCLIATYISSTWCWWWELNPHGRKPTRWRLPRSVLRTTAGSCARSVQVVLYS
ncbi:MAG: hypothetical protein AB1352_01805 [Patescibacteria group bacterium]